MSLLDAVTPLILTRNEEPNIGNTLARLAWAREIVVVDSFSTDGTMRVLRAHRNVRVLQRDFDSHGAQWNYGLEQIATPWVLALDADYQVTEEAAAEIAGLEPADDVDGYRASFRYCIDGKPLRGAVYPEVTVLFRRERARYEQDGHTQRVRLPGRVLDLRSRILHDDRKPLADWFVAQQRYMRLEAEKLSRADRSTLGCADKIRLLRVVAPFAMLLHCLIVRGGILDGRAGIYYAFQRTLAELLLSLHLLQGDLERRP